MTNNDGDSCIYGSIMDYSEEEAGLSEPSLAKRARTEKPQAPTLKELCSYPARLNGNAETQREKWIEATQRARSHPEEAADVDETTASTPLALSCRYGAPLECVQAIVEAAPEQLHRLVPSRGTPLHEAIVCQKTSVEVIELLLLKDEELYNRFPGSQRATLMQDVDGHTPLHLLIRRRFQFQNFPEQWRALLVAVVKSCPQAVGIPDRGEYEEPPLVMALKASVYAPAETGDRFYQQVEGRIRDTVECMLEHYPQAAGKVLTGARGQYTALHSAVFHGRCPDTISLLLNAARQSSRSSEGAASAALLANTQGELPLHFAAMRGEPPRSIALLGNAAPKAVITRDATGLTPMHWLWVRFVSTLLALDNERGEATVEAARPNPTDSYSDFAAIETGHFYPDFSLVRNLDPPVDFLRMRHIPAELLGGTLGVQWADQSVQVLQATRVRYQSHDPDEQVIWTRRQGVTALFWTKVVSLLRAAAKTPTSPSSGTEFRLCHAAMECLSCPPPVARMVCQLFPEELSLRDAKTGRLPVHCAAARLWHSWDWPRGDNEAGGGAQQQNNAAPREPASLRLLKAESLKLLETAIELSPTETARITDYDGRLVLHLVIDSFVRACSRSGRAYMIPAHRPLVVRMLEIIRQLVQSYPESLERRDAKTKLYPFLQASAAAVEYRSPPSPNGHSVPFPDEMPLSIVYDLLRENPTIVSSGIPPENNTV